MNIILSFILSAATLFSTMLGMVTSAVHPETDGEAAAAARAIPAARYAPAAAERGSASYDDIRYTHYDPEDFYADTDRLRVLAEKGDAEGAAALYDALYDEFLYIDSLSVVTMLRHDADFYDEYWDGEYSYMNTLWSETQDALYAACSDVLASGIGGAFAAHIGEDTAELLRDYVPVTEEELAASDRELELLDEYYALYDGIYDVVYVYQGEEWTLDKLYGFPGDALAERDYDAYLEIYFGIQEALCESFAPIYIELVSLWKTEAENAGYDDVAEYAYDYLYARDYSPADAQRFCDAVKPIARRYYDDLYYSDLFYAAGEVSPAFSAQELIDLLREYLPRVDESLLESWDALTSRGLYDIQPLASGRYDGAYTTTMLYYHAPFLFATLEDSCYDLTTITHEFGHFSDFWFNPQTNIFTQLDDLDLSEIHSNALQALFTEFYGEIYDEGADVAEFINLGYLLENIFDGCVYDEFQRRVLSCDEELTPEVLNRIQIQVGAEYGLYDEADRAWDSTWVYISHNFEQPLYYISYAASAMAALQIWDMAQTDFDAAADVYMDVLRRGAHGDGYFTVLEDCGLLRFTEEGAVEAVCRPVLDHLAELDRAYW